jgi:hypothetical protein
MAIPIAIASLVACLLTMLEHWLPWKEILGKELPRTVAYVMGTLAILLPVNGLALLAPVDRYELLAGVWCITVAAGIGCLLGYAIDAWLIVRSRAQIAEREAELLKPGADNGQDLQ